MEVEGIIMRTPWEDTCKDALRNKAVSMWYELEINRVKCKSSSRQTGGNKLRTYALFKEEWGYEPYLDSLRF